MKPIHLQHLRVLLARRAGLDLGRGGMEVNLANFVQQRLVARNLPFECYLEKLEVPGSDELRLLLEAMTVVYTWFFRDPGQFALLEQLLLKFPSERAIGIWVAGCATGEEPYSVALMAASLGRRVDILATDLNSEALRQAQEGRYSSASLAPVDARMRERYLGNSPNDFSVPEAVKQTVRFKVGNLVEPAPRAPSPEGWDFVICRNVLIYFGQDQARRTLDNLASSLAPGGYLVLGASEAILERPTTLAFVGVGGRAVLQRPRTLDGHPSAPRIAPSGSLPLPPRIRDARLPSAETSAQPAVSGTQSLLGEADSSVAATMRTTLAVAPERGIGTAATARSAIALGHAALDAGNIPAARESYERAVQLDVTCAEASMFAGIANYLDGNLTEALRFLRGALCLDNTLWAASFYQALCYENMGYAEDAAHSFSWVLKLASEQKERADGHPFLAAWRNDLLAVASKRAHPGRLNRAPANQVLGVVPAGRAPDALSLELGATRRSTVRSSDG